MGKHTLRVELHPFNRQTPVANTHDFTIIHSGSGHFETVRQAGVLDSEGVIACCGEWIRHPFKDTRVCVLDLTGFAMHQSSCAYNFASECLSDGLMPKADTKNWEEPGTAGYCLNRNAGLSRRARAWRHKQMGWCKLDNVINRDLVITFDHHFSAEFAEIVDDVIGERVVIIDDKDHGVAFSRLNVRRE